MIQNKNRKCSYRQDKAFGLSLSSSGGMVVAMSPCLWHRRMLYQKAEYMRTRTKKPQQMQITKPKPAKLGVFSFPFCASAGCPPLCCPAVQGRAVAGLASAVFLPSTVVVGVHDN